MHAIEPAEAWALFLDVDGTLLEFAEHPQHVHVPEGAIDRLRRLHIALNGAVALVSGREIEALDRLLAWERYDAAGCHGAETRIGGRGINLLENDALSISTSRLEKLLSSAPGLWIEKKKYATAIHLDNEGKSKKELSEMLVQVLASHSDDLRILPGRRVLEIVPKSVDKGAAISRFLSVAPYKDRKPIFIGDDLTDEEGFNEVNRRGGISICVKPQRPTAARYALRSVTDVHSCLDLLHSCMQGKSGYSNPNELLRVLGPLITALDVNQGSDR